jgi:hypothetical protein
MTKQESYLVGTNLFLVILVMFIINGLYINDFLLSFFKPLRFLLILPIALLFIKLALNSKKLKKNVIMSLLINFYLVIYALLLEVINNGIELINFRSYLFLVLSFFFTLSIFCSMNESDRFLINKTKKNFSLKPSIPMSYKLLGIFFIFTMLFSYFSKSFSFLPPLMNFNLQGIKEFYSQPTTLYFALGAIFFTFRACALTNKIRFFYLIIALLFLYVSFLSGARGEFISGLLVINLILFKFLSIGRIILYLFFLSGLVVGNLLYEIIDFRNFIMIERFSKIFIENNFGYRDILFIQSFALMLDRLDCVLIGCGFNFFQTYYSYDFGMYPHNSFVELIITFGLISVPLILLAVLGCALGYLTKFGNTFMFYVLLYFFLISLKSGTIFSITTIPIFLYFSYISLKVLNPIFIRSLLIFHK